MATAMTFSSLQTDLINYLERGSLNDPLVNAQLPELINFGERRCSRELKVLGFIVAATFTMQANLAVYPKPDRWRQTVSMNVGTQPVVVIGPGGTPIAPTGKVIRSQMYPRAQEYIREYWPDETATWTSVYGAYKPPLYYADYNYQNMIVCPTPDQAYPAEIIYYEEPPLLSPSNQSNWLTQYAPRLLLYACLIEMLLFLKKDASVQQALYDREAAMLNGEDTERVLDRNSTRQKD